jgi:hypothetical protein
MRWRQRPRRATHHCYHGRCKRLNRERGPRPVRCGSAQVAILALCMRDAGQCGFDPRRQGLAEDIGIEAAEVFADGSQKLLIRDYRFASSTLAHAAHCRLQVTVTVEVPRHEWSVNHLFRWLWITGTIVRFLAVVACLPSTQLDWALRVGSIALRKIPGLSFVTTAIGAESLLWLLRAT